MPEQHYTKATYTVKRWAISPGDGGFFGPSWWFYGKPPRERGVVYPWAVGVELFITRKAAREALRSVNTVMFPRARVVAVRVSVEEVSP